MKLPLWRWCFVTAALSTLMIGSPAHAQTSLVKWSSQGTGWITWLAQNAKATSAPDTATASTVTNLLFPTNNLATWRPGYAFPDQATTMIDGDALKVTLGKVEGDPWRSSVSQTDVPVKEGQAYVLSFKAKADQARSIHAVVQNFGTGSGDWHAVGFTQEVSLTTDWQTFSFPFTAIGTTIEGSALYFHLGKVAGTTWLSDVAIKPAGGSTALPAPAQALVVSLPQPGDKEWNVQLNSEPFELIDGHKYALSYMVKSDVVRSVGATVRINTPDWHATGNGSWGAMVGPAWRRHTTIFTAAKSLPGHNVVGFNLGGPTAGSQIEIGDLTLVDVTK